MMRLLVPCDFSDTAVLAFGRAQRFAREREGVSVSLLHVVPSASLAMRGGDTSSRPAVRYLSELEHRLEEWARKHALAPRDESEDALVVETAVVEGDPVKTVVRRSSSFDLVVMASKGRDDLGDYLLGTKTEQVIRASHCDVLVARLTDQEKV